MSAVQCHGDEFVVQCHGDEFAVQCRGDEFVAAVLKMCSKLCQTLTVATVVAGREHDAVWRKRRRIRDNHHS